jgi:uncharacterized protein (TIGR03083 family)
MPDDSELSALDPFDLLDEEAARIETHYRELPDDQWSRPSRCAGWSSRDVLAHLDFCEVYFAACLDGTVAALMASWGEKGATDLDSANAMGIAERAGLSNAELLERWRAASAENRQRFRERGDGNVDTTVGDYPNRWQSFHVASELATHADDVGVPVTEAERAARLAWRARFSRFSIVEAKPDATVRVEGDRTHVALGDVAVEVDDEQLVEAAAARLDDASSISPDARAILSTMP